MEQHEYGVLVPVGPDGVANGTLEQAALEAERRGTGVELLHVVHAPLVLPTEPEHVERLQRAMSRVGRQVLADAADRARLRAAGRWPVTTRLPFSAVEATIVERAAAAHVVVMERREPGRLERL